MSLKYWSGGLPVTKPDAATTGLQYWEGGLPYVLASQQLSSQITATSVFTTARLSGKGALRVNVAGVASISSLLTTDRYNLVFVNSEFEPSVAVQMAGPWLGVSSLKFNEANPIQGKIHWEEGYQFKVDIKGNEITLGARRNYGIPIECEEFFAVLKDCDDIISYLNGVGVPQSPGTFRFQTNDKVVLYEDAANHRIYVGLNFNTTDICVPVASTPAPNI